MDPPSSLQGFKIRVNDAILMQQTEVDNNNAKGYGVIGQG
jgi:hypothetical protein